MNKLNIILLYFIFSAAIYSSDYKYYELSYDFIGQLNIGKNRVCFVGSENSFLVYDDTNELYTEYYSPKEDVIVDILSTDSNIIVQTNEYIRIYDYRKATWSFELSSYGIKQVLDYNTKKLIFINEQGLLSSHDFVSNEKIIIDNEFNYKHIKRYTSGSLTIYLLNKKIYLYENYQFILAGEIRDYNYQFDELIYVNNKIILTSNYNRLILDEDFTEIEYSEEFQNYDFFDGSYYYLFDIFQNHKVQCFRRLPEESSFSLYKEKDIDSAYYGGPKRAVASINSKVFILGSRKFISMYEIEDNLFSLESCFFPTTVQRGGYFDFNDENIGFYSSVNSLLFLTTNGGSTWRTLEKDSILMNKITGFCKGIFLKNGELIVESGLHGLNLENTIIVTNFESLEYKRRNWTHAIPVDVFNSFLFEHGDDIYSVVEVPSFNKKDIRIHRFSKLENSLINSFEFEGRFLTKASLFDNKIYFITHFNHKSGERKRGLRYLDLLLNEVKELEFENVHDFNPIDIINLNENLFLISQNRLYKMKNHNNLILLNSFSEEDPIMQIYQKGNNLVLRSSQKFFISYDEGSTFYDYINQAPYIYGFFNLRDHSTFFEDIHFIGNSTNFFKGIKIDSDFISSVDYEVNRIPNFYAYNPHPNPTNGLFKIKFSYLAKFDFSDIQLEIYDIFGNNIKSNVRNTRNQFGDYSGFIECDFTNLNDGIYFIQMQMGKDVRFAKVIKMSNN